MKRLHWLNPADNPPTDNGLVLVKTIHDDICLARYHGNAWTVQPYCTAWFTCPTTYIVGWRPIHIIIEPLGVTDD